MGNVVSSLLMYVLQAAWFCQRLIDQDYRQNHGSRSKPIMDIDETDLDVFLSKCRSYYMSKNLRNSQIECERKHRNERTKKKWVHHRTRLNVEDYKISSSPHLVYNKSGIHAPIYTCLDFDSEGFLSKMDQELASRQADFTRLIMNENDFDDFLSKSCEISEKRGNTNERNKSGSSRTERWKRKKLYYGERYNPKSGQDRTADILSLPCEACLVPKRNEILTTDSGDIDSASRDDRLNLDGKDLTSGGHGREKRVSETEKGFDRNLEITTANTSSAVEVSEMADHDFILNVRRVDANNVEKDEEDELICGVDGEVRKILNGLNIP